MTKLGFKSYIQSLPAYKPAKLIGGPSPTPCPSATIRPPLRGCGAALRSIVI